MPWRRRGICPGKELVLSPAGECRMCHVNYLPSPIVVIVHHKRGNHKGTRNENQNVIDNRIINVGNYSR